MAVRQYALEIQSPDIGSALQAYRTGVGDRRLQDQENRQNSLRQYLPGALKGDKQAIDQVSQLDPEWAMKLEDRQLQQAKERQTTLAKAAFVLDTPEKWMAGAPQVMQQLGIDGPPPDFSQRARIMAEAQSLGDMLDAQFKERSMALDESRTKAQNAASYASADASRANASRDRAFVAGGGARPMPARLQGAEDDDIEAIQSVGSINAQLNDVVTQINQGKLELGPINNLIAQGRNYAGLSSENSVNYATAKATFEKMRNDSLRLNKGVQTEGDAVRAWNELIANLTDANVVKAQIARIKTLNERAKRQKEQLINFRRARNGQPPLDTSQFGVSGPQAAPPAPRGVPAPAASGPRPGAIEEGYEFLGGDPSDPDNWRPAQ